MAKIENRSPRTYEITGLPGKDGKVGSVYVIPHKDRETGTPGTGEIPDAVLEDLLARDAFTQGAFASGNDLVAVKGHASAKAEPEAEIESAHKGGHKR
jgi:hypothetical protein